MPGTPDLDVHTRNRLNPSTPWEFLTNNGLAMLKPTKQIDVLFWLQS